MFLGIVTWLLLEPESTLQNTTSTSKPPVSLALNACKLLRVAILHGFLNSIGGL